MLYKYQSINKNIHIFLYLFVINILNQYILMYLPGQTWRTWRKKK